MKRTLKILAIVALLPTSAFAAITGSKHDLSSNNTTVTIRSTNVNQICVFCHTPHAAQSTQLLWNHTSSAVTTFTWGVPATTAGTQLPLSGFSALTLRCLSCHDGSVALGSLNNLPNGITSVTMNGGVNNIPAGNTRVGSGGSMAGHHPLGIPYAGTAVGTVTYNTITNRALIGTSDYYPPLFTGCNTPTGACTNTTGGPAAARGIDITLYGSGGAVATATNVGIECASCHDAHNEFGFTAFVRVNNNNSGLCLSCHRK